MNPAKTGTRLASLGVHEHWNNPIDKQYSRNLGSGQGIELLALSAARADPVLSIARSPNQASLSWQSSLGYNLQSTTNLGWPGSWSRWTNPPAQVQGRYVVTNSMSEPNRYYRLSQ